MKFTETKILDVFLIDAERHEDDRGYFTRTFCEEEFEEQGISFKPVQSNLSHNKHAFTLRGMHYHAPFYEETKLVRCSLGRVFDVAVDIRKNSPTYGMWVGEILSEQNYRLLYMPEGFAHGFCVLSEDADVLYKVNQEYSPEDEMGIIWNDPEINIAWPTDRPLLQEKDSHLPSLKNADNNFVYLH